MMKLHSLWRISEWIGVGTYAVLIFVLMKFWIHPTGDLLSRLNIIELMYPFEFVLLHSAVFMSVLPKKISLFVLVPFYGLFVWGISHAAGGNGFLLAYFGIVVMRMRFAFADVSQYERGINFGLSIAGILIYFLAAILTAIFASKLPELGLTPDVLSSAGYVDEPSEAVINAPHQVVALTVIYFSLIALTEIYAIRKRRQHSKNSIFSDVGLFQN